MRGMRGTHARRTGVALAAIAAIVPCAIAVRPVAVAAAVRVRYPEGTAHAVLALTDTKGATLAHGELIQWAERRGAMASRLVFRFDDGSIYDELVRFAQQPVLRLLSYKLVQRGPSFSESSDISFDRSGRYRARVRESPDEDEKEAAGSIDIPEDVSNGMTSLVLKNLPPGTSGLTHLIAFTPKPLILELHLTPQGTERCFVGATAVPVTRFLVQPKVTGVKGVFTAIVGKQPPSFQMWLTPDPAPALLRFEGPLYADGPTWRIGAAAPTWKE